MALAAAGKAMLAVICKCTVSLPRSGLRSGYYAVLVHKQAERWDATILLDIRGFTPEQCIV